MCDMFTVVLNESLLISNVFGLIFFSEKEYSLENFKSNMDYLLKKAGIKKNA